MPRKVLRLATIVLTLLICGALTGLARRAADAPAISDTAVIESYSLMAARGHLLVGAYSRFQWHHPGPLYFYVLAPFYEASGRKTTGLNAGAAAVSIGSIAFAGFVLLRRRPLLGLLTAAGLALFAWRASELTTSPWNPHVPVLPTVALLVAAADVVAGNPAWLPLVAALASLTAQAHIALAPGSVLVGAIAFGRALWGARSSGWRGAWRHSLLWTTGVLLLVWCLPVYEQVTGVPRGNMTELWQYFTHVARGGQPASTAASAWADMFVGILRPDFYVAHGWPFAESPVRWAEWATVIALALVAVHLIRAVRQRDLFLASLACLLLVVSAVGLWAATRIEDRVFDHDVFWLSGVGVLCLAFAIDALATVLVPVASGSPRWWSLATMALVVVASSAVVARLRDDVRRSFEPTHDAAIARALADDLASFMQREHISRPLIRIDQDAWGVVAGAVLELQKRGTLVAVEEDWMVMFTPAFRPSGHEDAVVTVAMPPEHLRLTDRGIPLISAHEPIYAHAAISR